MTRQDIVLFLLQLTLFGVGVYVAWKGRIKKEDYICRCGEPKSRRQYECMYCTFKHCYGVDLKEKERKR